MKPPYSGSESWKEPGFPNCVSLTQAWLHLFREQDPPLRVYRTLNKNCVPTTVASGFSGCYGWSCWDRESENAIMN